MCNSREIRKLILQLDILLLASNYGKKQLFAPILILRDRWLTPLSHGFCFLSEKSCSHFFKHGYCLKKIQKTIFLDSPQKYLANLRACYDFHDILGHGLSNF